MGALDGRVALITGASRGIGRGIALRMAEEGANIVVNYHANKQGAEETANDVERLGRRAMVCQANVQRWGEVTAMVDTAVGTLGDIDILVNNAGQHYSKSIMDDDAIDVFHDIAYTHIFGSFYCTKAVLPYMKKKPRGDIHFISSLASQQLWGDEWAYASAKAWMNTFVKCLAKELSWHRIRVNVIAPTIVESDMGLKLVLGWTGATKSEELYGKVPFDRLIQPRDVGDMAVWLASDKAAMVSGQVIWLDCGIGPGSLRELLGQKLQ